MDVRPALLCSSIHRVTLHLLFGGCYMLMLLIRYSATSAELLMDMFRNAIMKLFALTLQIELFPTTTTRRLLPLHCII